MWSEAEGLHMDDMEDTSTPVHRMGSKSKSFTVNMKLFFIRLDRRT